MIDLIASFLAGASFMAAVISLISSHETQPLENEATTLNGIDLFAEHHGMQRKAGESDDDLIERVKRDRPVV